MSRYKNEQHSLAHNGRTFHFISYEGQGASASQGLAATPPSWFLVSAGKRWQVMPQGTNAQDFKPNDWGLKFDVRSRAAHETANDIA